MLDKLRKENIFIVTLGMLPLKMIVFITELQLNENSLNSAYPVLKTTKSDTMN